MKGLVIIFSLLYIAFTTLCDMYYIEFAVLHGTIPQVLVLFANGLEQLSFHDSKRSKLHDKQLRCVKQSRCIPKDAYTVYDVYYTSGMKI